MAKVTLRETTIASMPKNETVLLEGILQSMSLYRTTKAGYPYKYAITDKGVWTKSKKTLFMKSKEGFIAFKDLKGYNKIKYGGAEWFVFHASNGQRPSTRIYFDNTAAAEDIFKRYLKQVER